MPIDITMPRLSDTMEAGTVIKWHKKVGDKVSPGEILADIETDKATMELQAFDEGSLGKIVIPEGQSVAVGSVIAVLAQEGEKLDDRSGDDRRKAEGPAAAARSEESSSSSRTQRASTGAAVAEPPSSAQPEPTPPAENGHRAFASPLARKIAEEEGLDLESLHGSGPGGRIVRKDVEAALRGESAPAARRSAPATPTPAAGKPAAPSSAAPAPSMDAPRLRARNVPLSNMRRTIAKRLVESKRTIPHYQVTVSVRMDALLDLREQLNSQLASQGVKLSVNDFLVRACAVAMHQHPFVNSKWIDKGDAAEVEIIADVNVGVAIALPIEKGGGLVVATLRNADRMGLRQISSETKRLAEKARAKGLTIEEMADSTFTISNLGMFGVDHFTAIINPPNAAILAVGAAVKKPVVHTNDDGEDDLVIGHEMAMTMSSDHRIVDGAMAAQYLATVKQMLEAPATLLV